MHKGGLEEAPAPAQLQLLGHLELNSRWKIFLSISPSLSVTLPFK